MMQTKMTPADRLSELVSDNNIPVTALFDVKSRINDWIATGVKDEHWAIADDVFKTSYVEAEE